jgi:flavin-binding protein dodecin
MAESQSGDELAPETKDAFVGKSRESLADALEQAADLAYRHGKQGRTFTVGDQTIVLANPHVDEYHVTIIES